MLAIRVHSSRNYRLSPESSEYTFTSVYKDTNPDIVQCIYTHSSVLLLSCAQLFAMVWTVALQAPLSMGFFRQEYWSGLPFPPLGDLPDPGIEPATPVFPAFQVDSLPTEPSRKPSEDTHPKSTTSLPCVILAALQLPCWLM